jgi:hypothetical protein
MLSIAASSVTILSHCWNFCGGEYCSSTVM